MRWLNYMDFNSLSIGIIGESGVTGKAVARLATFLGCKVAAPEHADLVVASPGVPPEQYPKTQRPPISEIEFSYLVLKKVSPTTTLIAVTGTNGKSTVTTMIAHCLGCSAVGNIGVAFADWVADLLASNSDATQTKSQESIFDHTCRNRPKIETSYPLFVVVEVSSYQLESIERFAPDVSVLLNITPDHLDRHGDMDTYALAKAKIVQNQTSGQCFFYNETDPYCLDMLTKSPIVDSPCKKIGFSNRDPLFKQVLPYHLGEHNGLNSLVSFMTAKKAVEIFLHDTRQPACNPVELEQLETYLHQKLKSYKGLPHRIEEVATIDGITVYNDSKATNFDSTTVALQSFTFPVVVIMGGYLKPYSDETYQEFLDILTVHASHIVAYGDAADTLKSMFGPVVPVTRAGQLTEAVDVALDIVNKPDVPGQVLLFSPGYSSFDQFKNFEERGDVFKSYILSKATDA